MFAKSNLAALTMLASVLAATDASAGKYCGDPLESGESTGATQDEAILRAQQWWSSRAGALGPQYESWDNADDRALECSKDETGYRCRALARPCLPEGHVPTNLPQLDL